MQVKDLEGLGDRLLTRSDVAELFQVSPSTVTRWAEAGTLPSVKTLGGHRRYEARTVLELAQKLIKQGVSMETASFEVPLMYGDHHVLEVRRILESLPGVEEIYASSCFRVIEVSYDPSKVKPQDIEAKLDEAGYVGELDVPQETGIPVTQDPTSAVRKPFFRHTAAYAQTKKTVSFGQKASYEGRPLWPCPGMGLVTRIAEKEA